MYLSFVVNLLQELLLGFLDKSKETVMGHMGAGCTHISKLSTEVASVILIIELVIAICVGQLLQKISLSLGNSVTVCFEIINDLGKRSILTGCTTGLMS